MSRYDIHEMPDNYVIIMSKNTIAWLFDITILHFIISILNNNYSVSEYPAVMATYGIGMLAYDQIMSLTYQAMML